MAIRQKKESTKAPSPTPAIHHQRHSMVCSMVFTLITMMGKVRNMNQSDTRKDFLISCNVIIVRCFNL